MHKAGLADLPALAAAGADAGTTVAATLWAALRAGIPVFATGGIGGVHRGAETSFDVSGDLAALARFPGCVVCSGAKAVLDLPRTAELLETLGVCVVGFGVDRLPAFLARDSGIALRHRVDDVGEVAAVLRARDSLGLEAAVLLVNPPPADAALAAEPLEGAVRAALEAVAAEGAAGPAVTPRLLAELGRRTGGDSIAANRALLVANARLAGRLAVALGDVQGPQERPFAGPERG